MQQVEPQIAQDVATEDTVPGDVDPKEVEFIRVHNTNTQVVRQVF